MRGGKRNGAGRPFENVERHRYTLMLTEKEHKKVIEYTKLLRRETNVMEKAAVVSEFYKSMYWGGRPYPVGAVPVAVSNDLDCKGVLLYFPKTAKFALGFDGTIKSIEETDAKKIMSLVNVK